MYGILYAFLDFSPFKGFLGSPWVGLKHFNTFINSYYFWSLIRNTVKISLTSFVIEFPLPIILALLLNEVRNMKFKKTIQTISYFPHFISTVVIIGMLVQFTTLSDGVVNQVIRQLGGKPVNFMMEEAWFLPLYILVGIWQNWGWSSIIYLAALSAIDIEQYEAAFVDGATRFKQMLYISLPGIMPTITIILILNIGSLFSVSFEKILLMQNPLTMEVSDVINTYIYRKGLQGRQYSLSTAVGLFQTVINAYLLIFANYASRKTSETSLW
jgi:putative aldouronate transport system permease protein